MLEKIMTSLNFAWRQKHCIYAAFDLIKDLMLFRIPAQKILATVLTVFELFSAGLVDTPVHPYGPELDLTGYQLVFEDEFEGDSLDMDAWHYRYYGQAKTMNYNYDSISVHDGNLVIHIDYQENGDFGPGWYAGEIEANKRYTRGYFEIRCKVMANTSNTHDMWSAFWLNTPNCYDHDISKGGVGACEMDIMESFTPETAKGEPPVATVHALWCNGADDNPDSIDGRNYGKWYTNNPTQEYNTYGLMWTEDEYIWYVNGVETVRDSFVSGVCEVPANIIVSISTPVGEITKDKSIADDYVVDYVRVYQLPQDIA